MAFFHKNEITGAPQGLARGDAFLFETEEIRALGAEKRAADQGAQLFRRKRTRASEFSLGSPRETSNSVHSSPRVRRARPCRLPGRPGWPRSTPAECGHSRTHVLVEIVTCPIPLLPDLQRDVIEQEALTIEQLSASARTLVGSPSTGGSRISFLISRARRRFIRASFSARALSGMAAAWSICA